MVASNLLREWIKGELKGNMGGDFEFGNCCRLPGLLVGIRLDTIELVGKSMVTLIVGLAGCWYTQIDD